MAILDYFVAGRQWVRGLTGGKNCSTDFNCGGRLLQKIRKKGGPRPGGAGRKGLGGKEGEAEQN